MSQSSPAQGCLFGLALGDALGAPTEFLRVDEILARFPPAGPTAPTGNPARVTDDTQMALAVGEALIAARANGALAPAGLEVALRRAFTEWLNSPDNNRAPGMTCLRSCGNLAAGLPWLEATEAFSKGCGANMRVAPVGLLPVESQTRAAIAQFQAALTHGHPTALAASDLTAFTIVYLRDGRSPKRLPETLRAYAESQRTTYHAAWLGALWERSFMDSPEHFIASGWDECFSVLDRLDAALITAGPDSDPCLATGAGWVAEEAFATGLLCFLLFPDEPLSALRRAAITSGDSDSIACLAGAFAGARHGIDAWPQSWIDRIEYGDRLATLGEAFDQLLI